MDVCKQIFVSGRVQGVFFRDSAKQTADALSLTGGVRNLFDGRVEVIVAGEDCSVQKFIKWLEIGPKYAKVSTIEVMDLAVDYLSDQPLNSFSVWANR